MKYLLGEKLNFDWKVAAVTIASTLLLMVDHYRTITLYKHWDRVILYLVIPLLVILVFYRENPKEYGFSFGDWKLGLTYTALGILFMAPVIYYLGRGNAVMRAYYADYLPGLPWTTFSRSDRLGVFLSRLDSVFICAQVRPRCVVDSCGPVCVGTCGQA
ncbi:hypothetical protein [Candidatus Villigracilis affinis]|uniref:hypothetical protein n=1 Tax=Candidatus Villigracilis affinis TaxID=3140682 RepID=UPI0031E69634